MLRKLNVNKNDDIIQQKSIPVARVKKLLRSEEHSVSSGVTASLTSVLSPLQLQFYHLQQVQQPSVEVSSTTLESLPRTELCHLRQVQQPSVEVFYQTVETPQRAELYHLRQVQ